MHHDEAYASSDEVLADWLAKIWKTRTAEDGTREIYDPNAGLWRNDAETVQQARMRRKGRAILGSREEAWAANKYEKGLER